MRQHQQGREIVAHHSIDETIQDRSLVHPISMSCRDKIFVEKERQNWSLSCRDNILKFRLSAFNRHYTRILSTRLKVSSLQDDGVIFILWLQIFCPCRDNHSLFLCALHLRSVSLAGPAEKIIVFDSRQDPAKMKEWSIPALCLRRCSVYVL